MKRRKIENRAQIITLMGVVLAVSVFMISSLAAEIANIEFVVSSESSTSIFTEFNNIKNTFGHALNYNLIDVVVDAQGESMLEGNMLDIRKAFNQTRDNFFNITFKHDILFDAYLNNIWYSHEETVGAYSDVFYKVEITLYLDKGGSNLTEDVEYLIACSPEV